MQLTTFRIGEEIWAVEVIQVKEILRKATIFEVAHVDPRVRGLINLRGQIVTVLDFARCVNRPADPEAPGALLVLKTNDALDRCAADDVEEVERIGNNPIAIYIDAVLDIMHVNTPPASGHQRSEQVRAVIEHGDELILIPALAHVLAELTFAGAALAA